MARPERATHHVRVKIKLRSVLKWQSTFITPLNGLCTCEMGKEWPVITVATDASFSGFGACSLGTYFAGTWVKMSPLLAFGGH